MLWWYDFQRLIESSTGKSTRSNSSWDFPILSIQQSFIIFPTTTKTEHKWQLCTFNRKVISLKKRLLRHLLNDVTCRKFNSITCLLNFGETLFLSSHSFMQCHAKCGSNKFVQAVITVVVAFQDTVYIFYYEIHFFTLKIIPRHWCISLNWKNLHLKNWLLYPRDKKRVYPTDKNRNQAISLKPVSCHHMRYNVF